MAGGDEDEDAEGELVRVLGKEDKRRVGKGIMR